MEPGDGESLEAPPPPGGTMKHGIRLFAAVGERDAGGQQQQPGGSKAAAVRQGSLLPATGLHKQEALVATFNSSVAVL